jgi:hypothetical protein
MSQAKQGTNNPMYEKSHTEQSKSLISLSKIGKVRDNKTKKAISVANGTAVYLYAACLGNSTYAFCLIQKFASIREAGKYFGISHSNVSSTLISRNNINYKFSLTLLNQ